MDEAVGANSVRVKFGFEGVVAGVEPVFVAVAHPVGVGHEDHVKRPFGRPGAVFHQVVEGGAGDFVVGCSGVVGKLVEVGVGFVGDAFAVTVDEDSGEGGGFDGVFAELPNVVEGFVGALEVGFVVVPGFGERGAAGDLLGAKFAGPAFDFHPTEREDDVPFGGSQDGWGVGVGIDFGVAGVGGRGDDLEGARLEFFGC